MAFNVNAGELNKRIEILALEMQKDADGYDTEEREVVFLRPWAKVTEHSGSEQIKNGADVGDIKIRFLIRQPAKEITRKMTVRYKGKTYPIEHVGPCGNSKMWAEIWCTRKTKEGS